MATQTAVQQALDGFLRSRAYQFYIVGFMGIVALMDQYLSGVGSGSSLTDSL
jgi:hypothetical protein